MTSTSSDAEDFASAFRAAVADNGMSLSALQRRLADGGNPVSMATLSYWRSGSRQPEGVQSIATIEAIEDLFGIDRGHLVDRVRPVGRGGRVPVPKPIFATDDVDLEIAETAAALGTVEQAALRDLSVSLLIETDEQGYITRQTTRALVQSTEGLLSEIPLYDLAIPGSGQTKSVIDVIGGRVDRSMRHPGGRIVCDVLALDDPIPAGATGILEYTETVPNEHPDRRVVWHGVDRPNRQVMIWVRFAPGAEPDWCEEYAEVDNQESVRMLPAGRRSAHIARFGFGPGVVGIRWGYDDE